MIVWRENIGTGIEILHYRLDLMIEKGKVINDSGAKLPDNGGMVEWWNGGMLNFWSDAMRLINLIVFFGCLLLVPSIGMTQEEGEEGGGGTRYMDLKPAFVVNYGGAGKLRYLKTDISLRVGGDATGSGDIRHHMPYIRHALVMRLSRASEEELSSMEGKELLRQEALESVREILVKEEGAQYVEDLLFNSFIVQR